MNTLPTPPLLEPYQDAMNYLVALSYTLPRIVAMFVLIPIFNRQQMPNMLRMVFAMGLGVIAVPMILPAIQSGAAPQGGAWAAMIVKECVIGFIMGYMLAIPFWAFEAMGAIIDNQRGAGIAETINPQTGHDSSPLGILFNQAFIVFFFVTGGFNLMLSYLYDSYQLWDVLKWSPHLDPSAVPLLLAQLDKVVSMAFLLAAPVLIAMFLAEIGLAFVNRFVPQLQVFFLAMPIKSGLAFLMFVLYTRTLFEYGKEYIHGMMNMLPTLQQWWR